MLDEPTSDSEGDEFYQDGAQIPALILSIPLKALEGELVRASEGVLMLQGSRGTHTLALPWTRGHV